MPIDKLEPALLCPSCDVSGLAFETTAQVDDIDQTLDQARVVEAVRFGTGIRRDGYTVRAGSGGRRQALVHKRLRRDPGLNGTGSIHSRGVPILSHLLAARYAQDYPLSLSASLVFEQSYGGVGPAVAGGHGFGQPAR